MNNEIETFDFSAKAPEVEKTDWTIYAIDATKNIAPPEPILIQSSTDIALFNRRNISTTGAAMKVGKTFLTSAFISALLHKVGFMGFHCPIENIKALFVDTEMDYSDTQEVNIRVNKCIGEPERKNLDNFISLNLREVSKPLRIAIIEAAIIEFRPDIVFIDGSVDICQNFNEIEASTETIETLTTWATKYNCHINTCLHVNKGKMGAMELRGHLGSIHRQKNEVTLLLSKKIDTVNYVEVNAIDSRRKPIDDFCFRINNNALPEPYYPEAQPPQNHRLKTLFEKCIPALSSLRYSELTEKVMEMGNVKISTAKDKITKAVELGFIFKNDFGLYYLKQPEGVQEEMPF